MHQDYRHIHCTYINEIYYSKELIKQEHNKVFMLVKQAIMLLIRKIARKYNSKFPLPTGENVDATKMLMELNKVATFKDINNFYNKYQLDYYLGDEPFNKLTKD